MLYALEEEGKEKAEEPHPSQMEMVSSSERAFRDIFGDLRQQNTGEVFDSIFHQTEYDFVMKSMMFAASV